MTGKRGPGADERPGQLDGRASLGCVGGSKQAGRRRGKRDGDVVSIWRLVHSANAARIVYGF